MSALRSRLAILLLLCFGRVLVPDAWVLTLHTHQHTTEEPAHAAGPRPRGKALLTARHQHCQTDHFYNVAFQPATPPVVPGGPVRGLTRLGAGATLPGYVAWPGHTALRGPPAPVA